MATQTSDGGDKSSSPEAPTELIKHLIGDLKEHRAALEVCKVHTRALSEQLEQAPRYVAGQRPSFAEIVATPRQQTTVQRPLHSVIVSSADEKHTSEEVIQKLRVAVDAKNEGTRVQRLRKARDQKVIVGFSSREEVTKVKDRIRKSGEALTVEDITNKDPL
ncbi:hypothetical protein F3G54_33275, partial [Pseudomonas aeruginosa]